MKHLKRVLETGLPKQSLEAARQAMLARYAGELTEWHVALLHYFMRPRIADNVVSCGLANVLLEGFPELSGENLAFAERLIRELYARGLISFDSLGGQLSRDDALRRRTTRMGEELLDLIRNG